MPVSRECQSTRLYLLPNPQFIIHSTNSMLPLLLQTLTLSAPISSPKLPKLPLFSSSSSSSRQLASLRLSWRPRCSLVSAPPPPAAARKDEARTRPSPAEVSRTILELAATGTLSALTSDGWPLGIGARFVVDAQGTPAVCLHRPERLLAVDNRASFHVQFEQSGSRTPQCTILGSFSKPDDQRFLKKLCTQWEKKYGEEVKDEFLHLISIEKVLQMEDLKEDGVWVSLPEYSNAEPDPLRNFAETIVHEMNSGHLEDVQRLCNIYVETDFPVTNAKMIWVDQLGFDLYIFSEKGVFTARIPFPHEVTDEKGVKSTFNSMSHLAWEIEKNYVTPDFDKVKCLKKIR